MKEKNLYVLLAVVLSQLALAASGIAAEQAAQPQTGTPKAPAAVVSKDRAAKAVAEATRQAVESIRADTKLDLDIRLIGPSSVTVASEK
jgi:outer membrane receptor for ferric coprogen and ferric-rhodotorulic acid